MTHARARKVVEQIIDDFCSRAGLQEVWESIDEEVQDDIRAMWEEIVLKYSSEGER